MRTAGFLTGITGKLICHTPSQGVWEADRNVGAQAGILPVEHQ